MITGLPLLLRENYAGVFVMLEHPNLNLVTAFSHLHSEGVRYLVVELGQDPALRFQGFNVFLQNDFLAIFVIGLELFSSAAPDNCIFFYG